VSSEAAEEFGADFDWNLSPVPENSWSISSIESGPVQPWRDERRTKFGSERHMIAEPARTRMARVVAPRNRGSLCRTTAAGGRSSVSPSAMVWQQRFWSRGPVKLEIDCPLEL